MHIRGNGFACVGVSRSWRAYLHHALLPGSNAIDATASGECLALDENPLVIDQRGKPRVFGANCDVGGFEYGDTIFRNDFD